MTKGKDDPRIVRFMASFQKLRDLVGDNLSELEALARTDEGLARLSIEVVDAAIPISLAERRERRLFAAPVDPTFREAWRAYEHRYAAPLAGVWLSDLGFDQSALKSIEGHRTQTDPWEAADIEAKERAEEIQRALDLAYDQTDGSQVQDGIDAWIQMLNETGLDLRGAFRRRQLVPFVMIPRHVADRHGEAETVSLFTHLEQAHDAFILGLNFAALALMRAVLELCLIKHYGAEGSDLEEKIDSVRRPPVGVSLAALHRLRKRSNEILHLGNVESARVPRDLEREILLHFLTLRALIEGAPKLPQ